MVKLKLNLFSTLEYLVSFFIILECRSVYYLSIGNSKKIIIVMLLVSVSILCFFTVLRPDFHVDLKETIFLSFWNLYMFVYIVVSGGEIKQVILRYCLFFSLMYVYFYYWKIEHSKDFLKRYSNIVTIIAIISLVFWFFGSLLNYLEPSGIVNIYWGKDIVVSNYHYVYFQWQNDAVLFGKTFYRNIGIFSEAPMYVIHLSIAFMSSLFSKERNTFKLCVLFITMITTFSTAGIIIILLMIILKRAKKSIKNFFVDKKGKILIFSMPLMLAILIFIVKELVSNKLATNSGFSRLNDFYSGFMAWKDHPIFGAGYGDITSRLKYVSSFRLARAETGFTNSPFEVLDEGGIYLFLPFFMSFVFCLRYGLKKHNYEVICFLVGLTFIFVVCIFSRTFLILTFLAASHALFGIKKD